MLKITEITETVPMETGMETSMETQKMKVEPAGRFSCKYLSNSAISFVPAILSFLSRKAATLGVTHGLCTIPSHRTNLVQKLESSAGSPVQVWIYKVKLLH